MPNKIIPHSNPHNLWQINIYYPFTSQVNPYFWHSVSFLLENKWLNTSHPSGVEHRTIVSTTVSAQIHSQENWKFFNIKTSLLEELSGWKKSKFNWFKHFRGFKTLLQADIFRALSKLICYPKNIFIPYHNNLTKIRPRETNTFLTRILRSTLQIVSYCWKEFIY